MNYFIKKPFCLLACGLTFMLTLSSFTTSGDPVKLERNNWAEKAYRSLNDVINNYGINSKSYDASSKRYAVFDFDNTTAINDVEETLQVYQLEHLAYKIKPAEMMSVLTANIPDINKPLVDFNGSLNGRTVTTAMIASDIVNDYAYLYRHYVGLKNKPSLKGIHSSKEFLDFRCKLRYMYGSLTDTFGPEVSYAWIMFFFKGMNTAEVQTLTRQSVDYWMKTPYKKIAWSSPDMGKAGIVRDTIQTGFVISPEMKNLYHSLISNGIDVYICSASLKEIVEAVASDSKYGLGLDKSHVVGMMLKKDAKGCFLAEYDNTYPMTFAEGKVVAIKKYIAPLHNGQEPVLVGGDSDGDYNMLTEFNDMKCGLIFNRISSSHISDLCKQALNKDSRYVLQGRNENKGVLFPFESSIPIGKIIPQLFAK